MKGHPVLFLCVLPLLAACTQKQSQAAVSAEPAAIAAGQGIIITRPLAPTYGGDDYESELDDEMMYGMTGVITEDAPDAYGRVSIQTQYNYATYVPPEYFTVVSVDKAEAWKNAQTHWVIAPYADLMPSPDDFAEPVLTLPRGSLLKLAPVSGKEKWLAATLYDDTTAYIRVENARARRDVLKMVKDGSIAESEARRLLVDDALSYTGAMYRWGGKSPAGLDCSGFTGIVYMLNGVGKFRNSRPREGYPIALLYVPTAAPSDGASTHTLSTLAKAKPGDTVYWRGHEGFYLGEGRYLHSNGLSYNNRLNSLLPLDPAVEAPARTDLNTYDSIYTFGTPFPQFPQEIRVGAFWAANESGRKYRFLARLDGYCPNRVEIYPFGVDAAGNPLGQDLTANNPVIISRRGGSDVNTGATDANTLRYMLFDSPVSDSANVPAYDYPIAGTFTPAVKFFNDPSLVPDKSAVKGYLPDGVAKIESAVFKMPNPVVVR